MLKHSLCVLYVIGLFLVWMGLSFTPEAKIVISTKNPHVKYDFFYNKPQYSFKKIQRKATSYGERKEIKFRMPFGTPCHKFRLNLGNTKNQIFVLHKIEITSFAGFWKKSVDSSSWDCVSIMHHLKKLPDSGEDLKLLTTGTNPYLQLSMQKHASFHISFFSVLTLILFALLLSPFFLKKEFQTIVDHSTTVCKKFYSAIQAFPSRKITPYHVLIFCFLILCCFGITGSSIGLIRENQVTEPVGEKLLFGKYQRIRSDEYLAHGTSSAIQSYMNKDQFSIINYNIGLSGRNFLYLHDTGAPVKHPAMLIRPANWLFFITGLRQALAWYWWFPIFFGLFSILFLLNTLFKNNPWLHLLIAIGAVFCPYSAVFSFWPINCSAGGFLAAAALIRMFRCNSIIKAVFLGLLAGWGFSVSAATLYVPHIWPCITLAILIFTAEAIRELKEKKPYHLKNILGFSVFLLFAAILMFTFFDAIREPINSLLGNPKGVRMRDGGMIEIWELFMGWLFPLTLYQHWNLNQCGDQVFQFILLPIVMWFIWQYKKISNKSLCFVILAFTLWALIYQFVGVPTFLAKITGWIFVTERRVCYAIQIAQCLLLAALIQDLNIEEEKNKRFTAAAVLTLIISLAALSTIIWIPETFWYSIKRISYQTFALQISASIVIFVVTNLFLFYNIKWGAVIFSLITFIAGLLFNPICIAPIDFQSSLVNEIEKTPGLKYEGRILFSSVGRRITPYTQSYVMARGKTFNSFFCYKDDKIYDLLLKSSPNHKMLQGLNHMIVDIRPEGNNFSAFNFADQIKLEFNGKTYDFSKLPVDFLIYCDLNKEAGLKENKSLKYYKNVGRWQLWRVLH